MKIAFVGQKGIPATWGGIEFHVDRLSRGLVKMGHEVNVYVRSWYTNRNLKNYEGVRLIHMPTLKTKYLDASIHSFLSSIHALYQKYDIIHYHAIGPSFFSLIPKLFKKRTVSTVHRLDWDTEKWGKAAKIILKIGEDISVKIPERTIVVSEELKNYFKAKYGIEAIHIPNGIDLPELRDANIIKNKYYLKGRDYILFMGRLSPEKRVDWLINSFLNLEKITSKSEKVKLVIAGGSSATASYVQRLKTLSKDNTAIIFTGFVSGFEKEELLSNALIFALPSYLEGLPVALLEAKSYGLYCVASDIPPHREVIRDNVDGLLFNSTNPHDLTEKLQILLENEEKINSLGENASREAKTRLNWKEVIERTEQVYREIVK